MARAFGLRKQLRERFAFLEQAVGAAQVVGSFEVADAHGVINGLRDVLGMDGTILGQLRPSIRLAHHLAAANAGSCHEHAHAGGPVIAAGAIMDGRGLVASLALGAQGVQLGSRFLHAAESGTDTEYKKALVEAKEDSTIITSCFSGRPARAIKNRFTDFHLEHQINPLEYPIQNLVTNPIRKAAKEKGKREYLSLWAGQGTRLMKADQRAGEVIEEIMDQARTVWKRM